MLFRSQIRYADGVGGISVFVYEQQAAVGLCNGGERADVQRRDEIGHGASVCYDDVLFYLMLRDRIAQRNAGPLAGYLRDRGVFGHADAVGGGERIGVGDRLAGKGLLCGRFGLG